MTLLTADGIGIDAMYSPSARHEPADPVAPAMVIAHGFTGALERPALRRAAQVLTEFGAVVTFSFRGHGRSGGRSTVGDREVLDLDAAVRWARLLGHRRVATVGFSMGGSVVLRHAASSPVDAVVSVSAPARWYYRGTAPMRRVHWAITRPAGRLVARVGLRTRIHPEDWDPVPLSPVESVPLIGAPLLIVHGDRDAYFPLDHPCSLAAASDGAADLWIEPGFGHAENAAGPELLRRIGHWLGGRGRLSDMMDGGSTESVRGGGAVMAATDTAAGRAPAGTIRYWAAAKAAAGRAEEPYLAGTLAEALAQARARHTEQPEFARVLGHCSFLVDGDPVGKRDHAVVALSEGGTLEVLPPFAGG